LASKMGFFVVIALIILALILIKLYFKLTCGMYPVTQDLSGKIIMITGASAGIGKETAIELAKHNARLYLVVRNIPKGREVLKEIDATSGNQNVFLLKCDFCSLESVRDCAREFLSQEKRLDILINNAGMNGQTFDINSPKLTADGLEMTMEANHFGPFLLTNLLLNCLKASAPSRVVNTSSLAHEWAKLDPRNSPTFMRGSTPFDRLGVGQYAISKFANVIFTRELARRLEGTGVTTNVLHPGSVATEFARDYPVWLTEIVRTVFVRLSVVKTAFEGCQTTLYCALAPELEHVSGHYFSDCKPKAMNREALDDRLCVEFWEISEKLTGLRK